MTEEDKKPGSIADLKKKTVHHPKDPSHKTGSSNWVRLRVISLWEDTFYVGMSTF